MRAREQQQYTELFGTYMGFYIFSAAMGATSLAVGRKARAEHDI